MWWRWQKESVGAALLASAALTFTALDAQASERTCADVVNEPYRLRVRVNPAAIRPEVLAVMREEVDAIWQRYQVEIAWDTEVPPGTAELIATGGRDTRPAPDLWVQFVDFDVLSKVQNTPAIAWIPFSNGMPANFIRVSRPAAMRLLGTKSWFNGRPLTEAMPEVQWAALGRVIGRAVAHEIGHYLLRSGKHASDGLMRAALRNDRLVYPGRVGFKLQDADVRRLRATRITSCELVAQRP
jgi:hypothetical protein